MHADMQASERVDETYVTWPEAANGRRLEFRPPRSLAQAAKSVLSIHFEQKGERRQPFRSQDRFCRRDPSETTGSGGEYTGAKMWVGLEHGRHVTGNGA